MANYQNHRLDLFGDEATLKKIVETSSFQDGDEYLSPTPKTDLLPALSAHEQMEWKAEKEKKLTALRAFLKRPEPFLVMEWEAKLWAAGHPLAPCLFIPTDNPNKYPHRLSVLRFFYAILEGLNPVLPVWDTATGLPTHYGPYDNFIRTMAQQGILDSYAKLTSIGNGKAHLSINFGWARRMLPASANAIQALTENDLPGIHIIETIIDESNFDPMLSTREPGSHINLLDIPEGDMVLSEDGYETTHDYTYWLALEAVQFPTPYLIAYFNKTRDDLKDSYDNSPKE